MPSSFFISLVFASSSILTGLLESEPSVVAGPNRHLGF